MKTKIWSLVAVMIAGALVAPLTVAAQDKVIKFGVLPLEQPEQMYDRFKPLTDYLSQETGYQFEPRVYPTTSKSGGYTEAVVGLVSGETPFAYLAGATCAQARQNDARVEPIFSASREGSPTYIGQIAVRTDSAIQTVEDLRGKKIVGASSSSVSGNLMPSGHLIEKGIKKSEFAALDFSGGHDKAALAVLAGDYDACWINDKNFQKFKTQGVGLRAIWVHPPVPEFPICVNAGFATPEVVAKVKAALLKMHTSHLNAIKAIDNKYEYWVEMSWADFQPMKETIDRVHGMEFYDLSKQ